MFIDWHTLAAVALGVSGGTLGTLFLLAPMIQKAWNAYRREQDYEQAERVAAIVKDIIKTRGAPESDELHPITAAATVEQMYWELQKQDDELKARLERVRHMLNYKAGKG